MKDLSVSQQTQRLELIRKLSVQDDDGRWDAGEIGILASASKDRSGDAFTKTGIDYMTALFNDPKTQFEGDAKKSLLSVLVAQAKVDPSTLVGVTPDPVRLTFTEGTSSKFYALTVNGSDLEIRYGKIGTEGQLQTKSFDDEKAAIKEYAKRLKDKLKEGYTLEGAPASAPAASGVTAVAKPKKTIMEMDYGEAEELIKKTYGHEYEIVACEEWGNDSQHKFTVDGKLDSWQVEDVKAFAEGDTSKSFILDAILNDMAQRGVIEKGNWLITVCW